jgi:hypothetical protein
VYSDEIATDSETKWHSIRANRHSEESERRGHAEFDSFDRKVRQGGDDKAFHESAGTEAKDIP